jgi:hypothetical protein
MGTTRLCHIVILVKNLDKAAIKFTNGEAGDCTDCTDCRITMIQLENGVIEPVPSGKNASPRKKKLDRSGESVQYIRFVVPDWKKAQGGLNVIGVPKSYHNGYRPSGRHSFSNSVPQFGVEINIKTDDDNMAKKERLLSDIDFHKEEL